MTYPSNAPPLQLFVDRLIGHSPLSEEEQAAILNLPTTTFSYPAHNDIVRLGQIADQACLISSGLVGRYGQTSDGKRQFLSLHLPGEMIDLPSVVVPQSTSALNALTATNILKVPHAALRQLGVGYPMIAAAFWRDCMLDAGIVAQWLLNVGRRDARARTAHLLCELASRTRTANGQRATAFDLPMTQEQFGDALGLTPVHVNRVLRSLREDNIVTVGRGRVTIDDWRGLAAAGEFDATYLSVTG